MRVDALAAALTIIRDNDLTSFLKSCQSVSNRSQCATAIGEELNQSGVTSTWLHRILFREFWCILGLSRIVWNFGSFANLLNHSLPRMQKSELLTASILSRAAPVFP